MSGLGHLLIANIKRVLQSAGGIVPQYRRIGYIEEGVHLEDNINILLNILKSYKEGIHLEDNHIAVYKVNQLMIDFTSSRDFSSIFASGPRPKEAEG